MFTLHSALALLFMLSFSYGDTSFSEQEIMAWNAPEYLKTKYPYYLSGYDYEGSPVFVVEIGKWNFRSAVEGGPEKSADLEKCMTQMMLRWRSAGNEAPGSPGTVVIIDIDGIDLGQLSHIGVMQMILRQFSKVPQLAQLPGIKKGYIINANYLFERVFDLGKPLFGAAVNLVEVYGTNPAKWKPVLLRDIPAEELPAWYGGSESHQAVKVFGK